jgi:hypothetical protein
MSAVSMRFTSVVMLARRNEWPGEDRLCMERPYYIRSNASLGTISYGRRRLDAVPECMNRVAIGRFVASDAAGEVEIPVGATLAACQPAPAQRGWEFRYRGRICKAADRDFLPHTRPEQYFNEFLILEEIKGLLASKLDRAAHASARRLVEMLEEKRRDQDPTAAAVYRTAEDLCEAISTRHIEWARCLIEGASFGLDPALQLSCEPAKTLESKT